MNEELIRDKLGTHDKRLNDHAGRLDKLEQNQSRVDVKIENLCEQIKQLVSVMKWYIGLTVGALVSFFFYAIQHNIFK
ncbi:hypothetical protein K144313037_p20200 (plasmid) [Clostridium tetani]|uniref:hemolysin XhlA family protein n=1 Tax=Clostridium tetani TaxID=1513 RepID=UPI00100A3F7A|nr:hemolysin XhlA family protein [Clostridium tetani]RXM69442.1 hypothetical protein DP139_10400 [Clostridium tetani]RXM70870.1 hypothetical protein DP143_13680 [Clostridium tetani]BDR71233.1 hypothetical protein K144313037_p20200 [Clostridium tetani]BDR72237.1 hypothetical protein K144316041_09450 [Clostridium tetani]BDR72626.1 hypothetical protein K144316041_13340 [Clostridium tetani]